MAKIAPKRSRARTLPHLVVENSSKQQEVTPILHLVESTPDQPAEPAASKENNPSIGIADPLLAGWVRFAACAFDGKWYLSTYPDVRDSETSAVRHFEEHGWREGRAPNQFFNPDAYRAANPDLAGYEGNLFLHYVMHGASENRALR